MFSIGVKMNSYDDTERSYKRPQWCGVLRGTYPYFSGNIMVGYGQFALHPDVLITTIDRSIQIGQPIWRRNLKFVDE